MQTDIEHTVLGAHPANAARDAKQAALGADRLRSIIERHEHLDAEVKALNSDKSDIMTEAKSAGYHVKAIRAILKLRAQNPDDAREQEHMVDLYRQALGL